MPRNRNLNAALRGRNDEFYTQMDDITAELKHYRDHFRDKVVFCNCDDPYESNFFAYFALNFNSLGLKKLIATCYDGSPVMGNELVLFVDPTNGEPRKIAHKVEITEVDDYNGDGAVNLADVAYLLQNDHNVLTVLKGDTAPGRDGKIYGPGDFRSQECIALLKEADIVCTNPPFSLFREYVAQLMEYDKQFLIIGNMNALKYKEIFPLIMHNKLWMGVGFNKSMVFKTTYPNLLEANRKYVRSKGYNPDENYVKTPAIAWYTNLDHRFRHEEIDTWKHYSAEEYPTYDKYPAIEVGLVADIPTDYNGEMGVPITFLGKYNPDQFEIVGVLNHGCDSEFDLAKPTLNGKDLYARILIRRKK